MNNIFSTHSMNGRSLYETIQVAADTYSARFLHHAPSRPLTDEEQADADRQLADNEAEFNAMVEAFGYPDEIDDCPYGKFTTEAAAQRAVELQDAMSALWEDIHAFGAPSECGDPGSKRLQRELEALEAEFGVREPDPMVRELIVERDTPVWRALGFDSLERASRAGDDAILSAMGERSARR